MAVAAAGAPEEAIAVPPPNDARANAQPLGPPPAVVRGTTIEATLEQDETTCGQRNTVWYSFTTRQARDIILTLDAAGDLDAAIAVYERRRSRLNAVACEPTNAAGQATLDLELTAGGSYLVAVGAVTGSVDSDFTLRLVAPDRAERPPGRSLPGGGGSGTIDRLQNPDDAWSVPMTAGRTYRVNFVSRGAGCATIEVWAPGIRSFDGTALDGAACDAHLLVAPQRSGRHVLRIRARRGSRAAVGYRVQVGVAGPDDTAPGVLLDNDRSRRGSLDGGALDGVDLYRFRVRQRSALTVELGTSRAFAVRVLTGAGRTIARSGREAGAKSLSVLIRPGRYYVAVRAIDTAAGTYELRRLAKTITAARTLVDGRRYVKARAGTSFALAVRVSPDVSGRATFVIERFDPLAGWLFDASMKARVSGGVARVTFRPDRPGGWRVHGTFDGTRIASPSDGGLARFSVREAAPG